MKEYYETQAGKEPILKTLQSCALQSANGLELMHLNYAGDVAGRRLELALRKEADGSFKLDWESFVGISAMGWDRFAKERPTQPVLFRVLASPQEYYNYEFSDEKKYLSVRLTSPDGRNTLYAYTERGTPTAYTLLSSFARSPRRTLLTVKLAFLENAQSKDSIRLLEVVAERWFLLPGEGG
jgi:hypothetical protein